jgi:Fe-S cluster assembly protein SufD
MTKLQTTTGQVFGDTYADAVGALPGAQETWINGMRKTSRALVGAQGFPGRKVEAWKYTSLNQVEKVPFIPAAKADDVEVSSLPLGIPVIDGALKMVFVNGVYRGDLSDSFADLGDGVSLKPFADVLKSDPSALKVVLGSSAEACQSFTTALNTGFMEHGVVIHLAKNVVLERPIHLISIGASGAEPGAFHPRFSFSLEQSSSATVIESHSGLPGQAYLSNPITEILLREGAALLHYTIVGEDSDAFHLGRASVTVDKNAKYESFILSLGGQLVRREVKVSLEGLNASAIVDGVYALSDKQHSDITSEILHLAPNTTSNQVVKGVLGGESRGVFQGRVHVAREAQKTEGLEIYADDVQCAHGATTGEMDQNHIFYFLSRGIDEETARALLVEGFLDEVMFNIGDEAVRETIFGLVSNWLARQKIAAVSGS